MKKAMLVGRMFWTDKGPKYLVMLIILSLVIYMFATLLGSTNIAEDIGTSSKVHIIKLSIQRQSGSTKGHLISKANCQAVNSSRNRTNDFVFTTMRRVLVRFLEEIEDYIKTI